ncbi:MAG: hypothetical protein Q4B05_03080 [Candidatus Saccharibacteria bacterium]|nr:hypothetical protein [Candidatus Saccharibacteria bacterium]
MYEFSFGAFILGTLILASGATITIYHQKIADNLGGGVASYDRFKFWGVVICIVGLFIALGLHSILLHGLVNLLFHRS